MKVGLLVFIKEFGSSEDRFFDESIFEDFKRGVHEESNILGKG